jgi:outer membrane receptor protein involved in Fe transport
VTYDSPRFGRLAAHALHAGDQLEHVATSEPSASSRYDSDYAWLTLDSHVGQHLRTESVAWIGGLSWVKRGDLVGARPPVIHVADSRGLNTLGVRQDWSVDVGSRALFKIGADVRHERARYDYSLLNRDFVLQNHVPVLVTDSIVTALQPIADRVGVYVSQRVRPIDWLTVEVGARYDRASHTRDAIVSPRANASWQPTKGTTVLGSWGEYAQSASVFGLQVEDGVTTFAPADRSRQAVIGVSQALWNGVSARLEGYDRHLSQVRPRYVNGSGQTTAFPELAFDRMLIAPDQASARGAELSLERSGGRNIDWSASYVVSSSRQHIGGASGAWIPRPGDQPQALRADWSLHPRSNAWRFTMSEVWHSGWPYTPEAVQVDTIGQGQTREVWVVYHAGAAYSQRVPAYQRVDARWTRFVDTKTGRMTLFVDVYNLFNTRNLRGRYTNFSFSGLTAYQSYGTRENLPRIPSFGVSWEF